MTDEQLIQLVQETAPEDLSEAEIELLRARAGQSPELRAALVGHLRLEELLTTALSRHQVSVDAIFDQTGRTYAAGARWRVVTWTLALAIVSGLVTVAAWRGARDGEPKEIPEQLARVQLPVPPAAEAEKAKPAVPPPAAKAPEPAAPKAAEPVDPWTAPNVGRRSFTALAFEALPQPANEAEAEKLGGLWQLIKGSAKTTKTRWGTFARTMHGTFKLREPWRPGEVLRLSLADGDRWQLHVWHGTDGVSLDYSERPFQTWTAYRASRKPGQMSPSELVLAASDEDRGRRTGRGTVELRHQDNLLVVSRGDILLLAAPMKNAPNEVILEAPKGAALDGVAVVAGERFPRKPSAPDLVSAVGPADFKQELPPGARMNVEGPGTCALTAENTTKPAYATWSLEDAGLKQIIVRIGQADAGTGILLADELGRPQTAVGIQESKSSTKDLVWGYGSPHDRNTDARVDRNRSLAAAGSDQWLKLVYGGGTLKAWLSVDGENWARLAEPRPLGAVPRRIGVYAIAGKFVRRIQLSSVETRPLAALRNWSPPDPDKVPASTVADLSTWLDEVWASQPADVDSDAWRRACALRTLSNGAAPELARALIRSLAGEAQRSELPIDQRCRLLDELAILADTWEPAAGLHFAEQYLALGESLARAGERHPWTAVRRAYLESPVWTAANLTGQPSTLLRSELLELVYADAWADVRSLARQTNFFWPAAMKGRDAGPPPWAQTLELAEWAGALADRNLPRAGGAAPASIRPQWRHPLVEQLGREGYNLLAELEGAIESGDYKDACRIISSVSPAEAQGLLPNARDSALLVSLPAAVALAMQDHPPLVATMQAEFGPLSQLRLRQAIAAGDASTVSAVATQFYGTAAATEAHQWLGDRALARGDFGAAEGQYQAAAADRASPELGQIQARLRLAAAMLGRDAGRPPTEAVAWGQQSLDPEQFEQLIRRLKERHASAGGAGAEFHDFGPPERLEPAEYRARIIASLDLAGDPAVNRLSAKIFADQLSLAGDGSHLLTNTRTTVAAYEPSTGKLAWSAGLGGEAARGGAWAGVAMRPLVVGKKVFVRRLTTSGPELVSVDGGKLTWRSPRGELVASDPIWNASRLLAVTFSPAQQELVQMSLTAFDPETGKPTSQQPLAQFRDVGGREMPCELVAMGDTLMIVGGGCVLATTPDGRARWLRRESWIAGIVGNPSTPQPSSPPLRQGQLVYVAPRGVASIVCLHLGTGRLQWQRVAPDLVRMAGMTQGKLLVEVADGFLALDAESGQKLWHRPVAGLLDAELLGRDGVLVYAKRETLAKVQSGASLAWLDTQTGRVTATAPIEGLSATELALSPLAGRKEQAWLVAVGKSKQVSAQLVELERAGDAFKSDAETTELADWLRPERVGQSAAPAWRGWQAVVTRPDSRTGLETDSNSAVYRTAASPKQPAAWVRHVAIRPASNPKLRAVVAAPMSPWTLSVSAPGRPIASVIVEAGPATGAWKTIDIDLDALAGAETWLSVRQEATSGRVEAVWKELELVYP